MSRRKPKTVTVRDTVQQNYRYILVQPEGKNFDPSFTPDITPKEMLSLGVFGGKYLADCQKEFPASWFSRAKLSPDKKDASLNFFNVNASKPLRYWQQKGWIHPSDPRGWFQWYCRYYMGRRLPKEDTRQIKRWRAMRRHVGALQKHCRKGDHTHLWVLTHICGGSNFLYCLRSIKACKVE